MVLLDPRGRQRWKECAAQPVNTLTQRGKKLPTSSFPTIPNPSPTVYTWREGERQSRGGVKRMGRRAMKAQTAERWKVLNGKNKRQKGRKKVGGQKKKKEKMSKMH